MALHHPHQLLAIARNQMILETFLEGLAMEYLHCAAQGRSQQWAQAAHSIIDLIASNPPDVERRHG